MFANEKFTKGHSNMSIETRKLEANYTATKTMEHEQRTIN